MLSFDAEMTNDLKEVMVGNFSLNDGEPKHCPNSTVVGASFDTDVFCPQLHDGVSCWPITKAGTVALIPCFPVLNAIQYDASENATRQCFSNGTWASSSDYSRCKAITDPQTDVLGDDWRLTEITIIVYYIGYCISLVTVGIAFFIFLYFKELRCLRNTIHAHLMLTYVLEDLAWIAATTSHILNSNEHTGTCIMIVMFHYFKGTNFFWMFVEGFYLKMLVVKTFSVENISFKIYFLIGWGVPVVIVATWAVVKAQFIPSVDHLQVAVTDEDAQLSVGCPWLVEHTYDWIFFTPILLVLVLNVYFLFEIMWVLITKLRAVMTQESKNCQEIIPFGCCLCFCRQQTSICVPHSPPASKIHCLDFTVWKAAKALVVLIPLLGITYILVITAPKSGLSAAVFAYIRSVLISTQGATVAILYCFLNGEVQRVIGNHWRRWKDKRSFKYQNNPSMTTVLGSFTEKIKHQQPCKLEKKKKQCSISSLSKNNGVLNGCLTPESIISPPYIYVTKDSVLWEISV